MRLPGKDDGPVQPRKVVLDEEVLEDARGNGEANQVIGLLVADEFFQEPHLAVVLAERIVVSRWHRRGHDVDTNDLEPGRRDEH